MAHPIYSLEDIDPRSNITSYTTDTIMNQAQAIREANKKYYENLHRRMASGLSVAGGGLV